jgi:hypothetical protein
MSRRKQRASEPSGAARDPGGPAGAARERGGAAPASRSRWGLGVQIAFAVAVFAVAATVAELAGAANLGVSFGIGQIAFAIAVAYLLIRR